LTRATATGSFWDAAVRDGMADHVFIFRSVRDASTPQLILDDIDLRCGLRLLALYYHKNTGRAMKHNKSKKIV
jgi:hypothetical protein